MSNKGGAKEAVLNYLRQQNRPYSANDIAQNLHKEFGKTAIQKALDDLSDNASIKEKTYGKQKVYAPLQEDDSNQSDSNNVISLLETKLSEVQSDLTKSEEELKRIEGQLKSFGNQLSTEEAQKEVKEINQIVETMTAKLNSLKQNPVKIAVVDKEKITKIRNKTDTEFRKRKRICMDIANAILENYPKPKKAFFEEVGIETDEDTSR